MVSRRNQAEILKPLHEGCLMGHLGRHCTMELVMQNFSWFGMRKGIEIYVRACNRCGSVKKPIPNPKAPLGKMPAGGPMDQFTMDIMGPLPLSQQGNRYILVVSGHFTKRVEIFAIPDQSAETCADVIINEVITRYGCPLTVHSDQRRNFEAKIFEEMCTLAQVCKTRTTPGNPRCNGLVERFNRTSIQMIKSYLTGEQQDWDKHLGCLAGAY